MSKKTPRKKGSGKSAIGFFDFDGERLRKERGELTLDELSGRIRDIAVERGGFTKEKARKSFSASWLSKCERGENQPRFGAVALIAVALGKPMDAFRKGG